MRPVTVFSIAALLLGCALLADPSAAAEQAIAKGDPIGALVERLSASPLWRNGRNPIVELPVTATPDEVIARVFEQISFDEGQVTQYRILETRLVQIPGQLQDTYVATLVSTNVGNKIVLLKYEDSRSAWWSRVYDARSSR
jgi:hypothetical protein